MISPRALTRGEARAALAALAAPAELVELEPVTPPPAAAPLQPGP